MSTTNIDMDDGWLNMGNTGQEVLFGLIGGGLALLLAIKNAHDIYSIPLDSSKKQVNHIAKQIAKGAEAFLVSEYKALACFVVVVAGLLCIISWETAINFLVGSILSGTSGYLGMRIATLANVRTTLACQGKDGLNNGLKVAFKSGSVMALMVVGTGLLGLSIMYVIFEKHDKKDVWQHLSGFAFGGSSIALFARVGGGIYTKAADVGADLVGKVEEELEEDSADNPATIADNVGDNVGDVAGMGADLFESFVGSIIAAATTGEKRFPDGRRGVAFPFYVAGLGAIASIIGTFCVRADPPQKQDSDKSSESETILLSLLHSIRRAIFFASFLVLGFTVLAVLFTFGNNNTGWNMLACVAIGLLCGNLIGYTTEFATSYTEFPTQSIAEKSDTGPATVMIQGLGVGMISTVPPVVFIFATMLGAYYIEGFYGISISAVGMLSTLGVTLATDAFGPVADNAGGIAEMAPDSEISEQVRQTTDALDALGNTTAATGKGFAIGSAVLTALALMNAFAEEAGAFTIEIPNTDDILTTPLTVTAAQLSTNDVGVNLLNPVVLPCVLLGALLPFVFAALTMLSVGKAAESIMWECRDQLNKKHFSNTELAPDKCVAISTLSSLREMVAPGLLAITIPIIVGTALGTPGLLGLLTGAISSGFLLGVMMSNAGGAWDNAKKYVEKGNLGEGKGKKSENHKAVVVGDTVGDPFKDTSGPALNILIKLMSIVSLVLVPAINNEAWGDRWWVSLIVIAILCLFGYFFNTLILGKYGKLHDIDKIVAASRKRKSGAAGHHEEEKSDKEVLIKPTGSSQVELGPIE